MLADLGEILADTMPVEIIGGLFERCLLYTSDAADDM
jgi:hypothetical protein